MYISVGSGLDDRVIQVTFLPSQAGLIYKKIVQIDPDRSSEIDSIVSSRATGLR